MLSNIGAKVGAGVRGLMAHQQVKWAAVGMGTAMAGQMVSNAATGNGLSHNMFGAAAMGAAAGAGAFYGRGAWRSHVAGKNQAIMGRYQALGAPRHMSNFSHAAMPKGSPSNLHMPSLSQAAARVPNYRSPGTRRMDRFRGSRMGRGLSSAGSRMLSGSSRIGGMWM